MAQEPNRPHDLFTPSLQASDVGYNERPWKLSSQFWVAFLGGTLAIAVISYFNAKRLKLPPDKMRQVLLLGVGGVILTFAMGFYVGTHLEMYTDGSGELSRYVRLGSRIVALLLFYVVRQIQEPFNRRFLLFYGSEEYDSLWKPGLAAVLGLGLVQGLIMAAISLATAGSIGML